MSLKICCFFVSIGMRSRIFPGDSLFYVSFSLDHKDASEIIIFMKGFWRENLQPKVEFCRMRESHLKLELKKKRYGVELNKKKRGEKMTKWIGTLIFHDWILNVFFKYLILNLNLRTQKFKPQNYSQNFNILHQTCKKDYKKNSKNPQLPQKLPLKTLSES